MKVKPNFLVWKFRENAVARNSAEISVFHAVKYLRLFSKIKSVQDELIDFLQQLGLLAKLVREYIKILAEVTKIFQKYSLKSAAKKIFVS